MKYWTFSFLFIVVLKLHSQLPPNPGLGKRYQGGEVGAFTTFDYVNTNQYDFITGNSKPTLKNNLRFQVYTYSLWDRWIIGGSLLNDVNMPSKYFDRFIFRPSWSYGKKGRPAPWGRNQQGSGSERISIYGKATTFNPPDWEKSYLNWPYGPRNYSTFLSLLRGDGDAYPEATPDNWNVSYSLPGAFWSQLYKKKYSTHSMWQRAWYGPGLGSIPGQRDPLVEYYIPNEFWNDHDFLRIETTLPILPDLWRFNEPQDMIKVNYVPAMRSHWTNGNISLNTYIYPYEHRAQDGTILRKETISNNSPRPYDFGIQGAYKNGESFFSSFSQDKEGDLLIYRWEPIVDFFNGSNYRPSASIFDQCNELYQDCNEADYDPSFAAAFNGDFKNDRFLHYTKGYSAENPIKYIGDDKTVASEKFYINPYSGVVKFINNEDPSDRQLRVAGVAIDQYRDGQLIGTTMNMVPYFPQPFEDPNRRPLISFASDQAIAQKTTFDFDVDLDKKYNEIEMLNTSISGERVSTTEKHQRVIYKEVHNDGEVLLYGMDIKEGGEINFQINYSDPDNDKVNLKIIPVIPDLYSRYPWTLDDDTNGTAQFTWQVPSDISEFTSLNSYSFMFMVYAEDNAGILDKLNGQNIEPFSITVHSRPGVVITSSAVNSGDETNHQSIPIKIELNNIESTQSSGTLNFELELDDFILTNALISNLNKSEDGTYYTAILSPTLDPRSIPVSTSITLPEDKFILTKTGGHGMNTVNVPNTESNLFEWTSNQIKPTVKFEFFDSQGNSLNNNTANNSPYIVGKITPSVITTDFVQADLNIDATNASITAFRKVVGVDETYYNVTISASNNTSGTLDFSINENVFSDQLGNLNLKGNLASSTSTVTLFKWNFDRIRPQVTISNPYEGTTVTTVSGTITFLLSEEIRFENNTLEQVLNDPQLQNNLIGKINDASTNAYFTNFSYNISTPNQFTLTVNHAGGNRVASLVCPEEMFTDLLGNRSIGDNSSHSYNLNLPRLSNLYSVTKNSRSPYNYIKGGELKYLVSTSPVEMLLGFSGQSRNTNVYPNNDNGYEGTWDGRNFSVDEDDFILSSGTISNIQFFGLTGSTDELGNKEQLFKALYTPDNSYNGFVEITHKANSFLNVSGTPNIESRKQFVIDTTSPLLSFIGFTIDRIPVNQGAVTNESDLIIEVKANEPVAGLVSSTITFWKGNTKGVIQDFEIIDQSTFRFKVTHFGGDGGYRIYVYKRRFTDLANNINTADFTFDWYYDTTSPSVSIQVLNGNSLIGDNEYVANKNLEIKYVFNESGMNSGPVDQASLIELLNDNASNISFTNASFNSANQIITATGVISNTITSPSEITIDFPKDIFKDRGGNLNNEANQRLFIFDDNVPEPTILLESSSGTAIQDGALFTSNTLSVTFEFSADLPLGSSFSLSELESILSSQLANGTLSNLQQAGNSYTAEVSDYNDGEITIKFPKDLVSTSSGVKNIEAISTVVYDGTPPNAVITVSKTDGELLEEGSNTNQENLNVTIVTTEISNDLIFGDLNLVGNVSSSGTLSKTGNYTYSFTVTNTSSGLVTLTLAANSYSDPAGNSNNAETQFRYDFDNIRPVPTITSSGVSGTTALSNSVPFQLNFSEAVEFSLGDDNLENYISSLVKNARVSDFSKADNGTINFIVNRVANGTVSVTLPENVFYDTHENGNTSGTYNFEFNNSIELTKVEISSDNSLEQDYTLSYTWSGNPQTRVVPGTRNLLNQGVIETLYVNKNHSLTFYFESNAEIQDVEISIDGITYNPSTVNNDPTKWELIYPVSDSSNEGKVEFEIKFSDTTSKLQPLVTETTDNIYYTKDFTSPVFEVQLFMFYGNGKIKIEDFTKPFLPVKHSLKLNASETIYDQLAYQNVQGYATNSVDKIYKGNLALLAAQIQYYNGVFGNYHNPDLFNRISSNIPFYTFYNGYYEDGSFSEDKTFTTEDLIFYPGNSDATGSYSINVPEGYFMDLAGNKSLPTSLNGLKVLGGVGSIATSSEAVIEKKDCEYVTKASFSRVRSNTPSYTYFETDIIVQLSSDQGSSSIDILEPYKINQVSRDSKTYSNSESLSVHFELDIENTTWVRFKTIDKGSQPLNDSNYTEYFQASNTNMWEQTESYTEWQLVTINENPIEVSGVNQICGLGQTETYTVNTTGGSWSVSDETIATIDASSGVLTSVKAGAIEVTYTTADGCTYAKSLEIFNATEVNITANGQVEFCEGYSVKLTADTSKNLVWYKDNNPLPQITSSVLNLENNTDSGSYKVKYNTPCGPIWSNEIRVKVNSKPSPSKVNSTSN